MIADFGTRLRALRLKRKLTQTQVASAMRLSKAAISGYENDIKYPSLEVLIRLALFYNVPTDYLLGLEEHEVVYTDGLTSRQRQLLELLCREFQESAQADCHSKNIVVEK